MPEGVVILCRNYLGERIAVAVRVVHCIWRLQFVIDIMLQEFMEMEGAGTSGGILLQGGPGTVRSPDGQREDGGHRPLYDG